MDFLAGLLTGSLLPFMIFAIGSIIIITALEFENGWFPALSVVGTLLAFHYLAGLHVFSFALEHWGLVLLYLVGYILAGSVYSAVKWYSYSTGIDHKIEDLRRKFLHEKKYTDAVMTPSQKLEWEEYFKRYGWARSNTIEDVIPVWSNYKALLATWVTYWPWSLLWTLLNDPIRRLVRFIVHQLQDVYQRITDHVFANTRKHLLTPEERKALLDARGTASQTEDENTRRSSRHSY